MVLHTEMSSPVFTEWDDFDIVCLATQISTSFFM